MAVARTTFDASTQKDGKQAGNLDDQEAAAVLVEAETKKQMPPPSVRKRLDVVWKELVGKGSESGPKAVNKWLESHVRTNYPDRFPRIFEAITKARSGGDDEQDDDGGDIVDRRPVFDETALYGLAGEIVMAADPHSEADRVAVLVQFLAGFANAVGRGPHWVAGATKHYLSIYIALVGVSAFGRKGSSWDVVRYFLQNMDEAWADERLRTGMSSGEGLIYHVRDRVAHFDKDGEEIEDDPGVTDKRLFLIEPELSRPFKIMNRDTSTLSDTLRSAWDTPSKLATLTKHNSNTASNPLLSVVGHITKADVDELLSKTDALNGTGNRFLWVFATRRGELPFGGEFYEQDWQPLINRLRAAHQAAQTVQRMDFDAEAKAVWVEKYHDLSDARPGILGVMLARAIPYVRRIACIYALLDGRDTVGADHLHAAFALWKYVEDSARFIFGESLGDPNAEKLLAALRAEPGGMTQSAISVKVFNKHLPKKSLEKVLEGLLNLGLVHRLPRNDTGGRPAMVWFAGSSAKQPRSTAKEREKSQPPAST